MSKNRLEAFSDGVMAIIITIMVLALRTPNGEDWSALESAFPVFWAYVLSFVYVGIYWNNHHHLVHTCRHVTGPILWANLHLLFWLSLVPFTTGWLGEQGLARVPVVAYGFVLLLSAIAYYVLQQAIIASHGPDSVLQRAVGADWKGKMSLVLCAAATVAALRVPTLAMTMHVVVALMWLVPDRRIERALAGPGA